VSFSRGRTPFGPRSVLPLRPRAGSWRFASRRGQNPSVSPLTGSSDGACEEESTTIQWTLWGNQAESAAVYLGKGSHVDIDGRLHNTPYEKDGETVDGRTFTAEEIDYLDSRVGSEARRTRGHDHDGASARDDFAPENRAAWAGPGPIDVDCKVRRYHRGIARSPDVHSGQNWRQPRPENEKASRR
jgi:single-stranded DNA-binding protein